MQNILQNFFPHLKECGLIEAKPGPKQQKEVLNFPHLKECGLIEARFGQWFLAVYSSFPHLKECGLIEAMSPVKSFGTSLASFRT